MTRLMAQILRNTLLADIHRATRAHKPTRALQAALRAVTAELAGMEGRDD